MAGIAGLICLDGKRCSRNHQELLTRLGAALQHRGELVGGSIENGMLAVVLRAPGGFARSVTAATPARNGRPGRLIGVLDGELHNGRVLEAELAALGRPATGANGAELALSAWEAWGADAPARLEGRFATVLCDARCRRAILMRDRFGSRPLVYAVRGKHLLFASDVRALLAAGVPCRLDERALIQWCLFEDVAPPATLFDGILALPPGEVLEIEVGAPMPRPRPYFYHTGCVKRDVYEWIDSTAEDAVFDRLDGLVRNSVLDGLPRSGTAAVMLSGGVDSSVVAAVAAREAEVHAYHLSVAGHPKLDERSAAASVANQLGIDLDVLDIDAATFRDELAEATWVNELPLWHSQCVPFRLIARRAGQDGMTTVLTGDVLDGLFGLGRHKSLHWLRRAQRFIGRFPPSVRMALTKFAYEREGLPATAPAFVRGAPLGLQLADRFIHSELRRQCEEAYGFVADPATRGILGGRLADLAQWAYRFQHRGDHLCAASGVEYRTPYQDLRLTSMTMNLPLRFIELHGKAKWVLRRVAARYLSDRVALRPKQAWAFPVREYLEPLARPALFDGGFCEEALKLPAEALARAADEHGKHFSTYYRLLQTEVWGRLYFMGQSVDEVRELLASVAMARAA